MFLYDSNGLMEDVTGFYGVEVNYTRFDTQQNGMAGFPEENWGVIMAPTTEINHLKPNFISFIPNLSREKANLILFKPKLSRFKAKLFRFKAN